MRQKTKKPEIILDCEDGTYVGKIKAHGKESIVLETNDYEVLIEWATKKANTYNLNRLSRRRLIKALLSLVSNK